MVKRKNFVLEIVEETQINTRRYLVTDLSGNDQVKAGEISLSALTGDVSDTGE